VSPLTVRGKSRAVLEQEAHRFVESYAAPTAKLGRFARWNEPACVVVTGLIPDQAAQFRGRVEEVATAVRAPMAKAGCAPNIEIVFTNEPQLYLDAAAARSPAILGYEGVNTVTRPIQAWYATGIEGQLPPAPGLVSGPAPPAAGAAGYIDRVTGDRFKVTRGAAVARPCVDTRSPTCPHSLFLNVLVIVDAAHMGDVSVGLTSDYLAMLALSQPQPRSQDGCMALPSIFDLYAKDCPGRDPPTGLTPADMAYLTSLYAADLTVEKASEQSDIARRMAKILASSKEPSRQGH
jgi:hypothetical protein